MKVNGDREGNRTTVMGGSPAGEGEPTQRDVFSRPTEYLVEAEVVKVGFKWVGIQSLVILLIVAGAVFGPYQLEAREKDAMIAIPLAIIAAIVAICVRRHHQNARSDHPSDTKRIRRGDKSSR